MTKLKDLIDLDSGGPNSERVCKFTVGENKDQKMVQFRVLKKSAAVEDKEHGSFNSFLSYRTVKGFSRLLKVNLL